MIQRRGLVARSAPELVDAGNPTWTKRPHDMGMLRL